MIRLIAIISAAIISTQAVAADLTVDQLRVLLSMSGLNPGTSKRIGNLGIQTLTKVDVQKGKHKGDFVIHVHIVNTEVAEKN